MSGVKKYKRKMLNFSINRNMQVRMIGKICLILFVSQLLSGVIFFYFSNQEITASFQMFHIKARNFLDFLWPVVGASMLISVVVGFLASLFFPKPIAGALYRIEEDLKKATAGDLTVQIRLRGGDQVEPVAAQINRLLADRRGRVERTRQALDVLNDLCESDSSLDVDTLALVRKQLRTSLKDLHLESES